MADQDIVLWDAAEAEAVAAAQLGSSACGATALLNVCTALGVPADKERALLAINTRLRRHDSKLPDYLLSRKHAGCDHDDLLSGMHTLSNGAVCGRFFPCWPPRFTGHAGDGDLVRFLAGWMQRGAVAVAVLNIQAARPEADAWHHQMVRGVQGLADGASTSYGTSGGLRVLLTNRVEEKCALEFECMLASQSTLLVRPGDILARATSAADVAALASLPDDFAAMDVLGQVRALLKTAEANGGDVQEASKVRIPACYTSGLCLFARADTELWHELCAAPELPVASKEACKAHSPSASEWRWSLPGTKRLKRDPRVTRGVEYAGLALAERGPGHSTLGHIDWGSCGRLAFPVCPLLASLHTLTSLRLADQGLTVEALPAGLWDLASLERLDLARNSLVELPAGLGGLKALRELDVARNRLRLLPPAVGLLVRLEKCIALSNRLWPLARSLPLEALERCTQLKLLDLRFNDKLKSVVTLDTLTRRLPNTECLLTLKGPRGAGNACAGGGGSGSGSGNHMAPVCAGDLDASLLQSQLEPLSTPTLRKRLAEQFGLPTDQETVGRAGVMQQLLQSHQAIGPRATRSVRGKTLRHELESALLDTLRAVEWLPPGQRERPKVRASGYLTLQRPKNAGGPPLALDTHAFAGATPAASKGAAEDAKVAQPTTHPNAVLKATMAKAAKSARLAAEKLEKHRGLWDLAVAAIQDADPAYAATFTAIAVSFGFQGSPHIDTYDIAPQYALSLGDFVNNGGGELCVEESAMQVAKVDTRGAMAKVDGRFPHWVLPYQGERFSIIWFTTAGTVVPATTAVFE